MVTLEKKNAYHYTQTHYFKNDQKNKKPHIFIVFIPGPHKIRGTKIRVEQEVKVKKKKNGTEFFEHSINMPSKDIKHTVHVCILKSHKLMGKSKFDGMTMNCKDDCLQYKLGKRERTSPFSC